MSKTSAPAKTGEGNVAGKRCVACAGEASTKIVRDANFEKVMRFYWEGLSVDVKPNDMKTQELCGTCWDALVEFYDTNDVLVLMESHLRKLQKSLITQAVKGIETLNKDGQPLLSVHKLITEKWGDGIKSDDDEPQEVHVTTYLEDPKSGAKGKPEDSKATSSQASAKPASAAAATRGGRNLRGRPPAPKAQSKRTTRKRKNDTEDETSEATEGDSSGSDF